MNEAKMRWIEQQALMRYREQEQAEQETSEVLDAEKLEKLQVRSSVINAYDRLAAERIIDHSDFLPIAYLEAGVAASRAVCRIVLMNGKGEIQGYGTGFLISPSLIMTNNHVLETPTDALYAVAEFNFEDDVEFQPREIVSFRLEPDRLFVTDEHLDFTIVAARDTASNGVRLAEFGYLPLLSPAGKVLEGEYVSIIQHPKGGPKVVTLRENEVVFLSPDFIHYVSDTEPGSSGSPVFNDQWVVVALHHAGVPDPEIPGEWIANEGIRISSILRFLQNQVDPHPLLEKLLAAAAIPDAAPLEVGTLDAGWYENVSGYDPAFLGKTNEVPLPTIAAEMEEDIARTKEDQDVLDYAHFSIMMSKSRRLAFYTAVNIDGNQLVHVKRGNDKWYFDPRLSEEYQSGPALYARNDLDRGHLTRRQDPNWGIDAVKANAHTFHFTNCAPQHKNLNQKTWLKLEDYILRNADVHDLKATVFTGPVFREDDLLYRGEFRIPAEFWKVAVIVKKDGTLSATAYLQTQRNLLDDLEFTYGEFRTYQVPVNEITKLTGLDFDDLFVYDPLNGLESAGAMLIENPGDVRL
ncbi:DNA/RNA non-specific endonuclease [Planococcus lenghuensis]|uniref:Endonuclease n=1 Tax=Planococcus lenghuensis TaxID=2213202 RepID=A0A1Q2KVR8_9BACL|nr:DNA/RNA non-specific endonuclease [Planococcus lenghuensis]AQQ52315.1 endonuclease [Planococcus lenghuensis]